MRPLFCALLLALVVGCAGGVDENSRSRPIERPQIVIGPKLKQAGVTFRPWQKDFIYLTTTMEVSAGGEEVSKDAITVTCVGRGGVKHDDGHSDHPAVRPGEKGKIKIFASGIHEDVAVVTLDLR